MPLRNVKRRDDVTRYVSVGKEAVMQATQTLRAAEREAFQKAAQMEHSRELSPEEREAVWAEWVALRVAAYQASLRASLAGA
jgi:hypothetical protein